MTVTNTINATNTANSTSNAMYNDFGSLASLRSKAAHNPNSALEQAASQFESLFLQMMLKSMRDATMESDLFSSSQMDTYQQMFDQQLSLDLSNSGGLGLAKVLVEQLKPRLGTAEVDTQGGGVGGSGSSMGANSAGNGDKAFSAAPAEVSREFVIPRLSVNLVDATAATPQSIQPAAAASTGVLADAPPWRADSPADFVRELWPAAQSAAKKLGVDPAVLVAQSALETGWGKHVSADAGGSSHNLFNIKANADWQGRRVMVSTIEYSDGVAVREQASFRAYDNLQDAFADYVDLIRTSPRYQSAMEQVSDSGAYLKELQSAGYATDPNYADKVIKILEGDSLNINTEKLKNSV